MEMDTFGHAFQALAIIGLLLGVSWWLAQWFKRKRLTRIGSNRLVTVLESTMLSPQVALHVVKIASRCWLVGSSTTMVSAITELPTNEIDAWLEEQRRQVTQPHVVVSTLFQRLRGPS